MIANYQVVPHDPDAVHSPLVSLSSSPIPMLTKADSPQPGPSILLNPYCRSSDALCEARTGSRFSQLTCALKSLICNMPLGDHASPEQDKDSSTGTSYSQDRHTFSDLESQQTIQTKPKQHDSGPLSTASPTGPLRSPVVKFAPLPQIHNRAKRANSISIGVASRALLLQNARESLMMHAPETGANTLSSSLPTRQRPEWLVDRTATADLPIANPNPISKPKGRRRKRQGKKERQRRRIGMELSRPEGMDKTGRRNSSSESSASDSSTYSSTIFEDCEENEGSASSVGQTSVTSGLSDKADDSGVEWHEG